jgi:hypothetical protein
LLRDGERGLAGVAAVDKPKHPAAFALLDFPRDGIDRPALHVVIARVVGGKENVIAVF